MLTLNHEQKAMVRTLRYTIINTQTLVFLFLGLIVFALALTVVCEKNLFRKRSIELQKQYSLHDQLETEWGQLLIEENTWAAHSHVEYIAQSKLDMAAPLSKQIQLITLPTLSIHTEPTTDTTES